MGKKVLVIFLAIFFITHYPMVSALFSDTIQTNDGKEVRGIIVEDYKDRIVLSTVDGEITTLKSEIQQLYYDSEADNLVKLAEQSRERGDMTKALAYYDMALRADPNSKPAKDGVIFLQGYLFRKEQVKKEDEVKKQEEFENFGSARIMEGKSVEEKIKDLEADMRRLLGITLSAKGGGQVIESVRSNSPAADAGARRNDMIVAVWGRLTGYMPLEDVMKAILDKPSLEIKCTIERDIALPMDSGRAIMSSLKDMIGATFSMQFDGLTVSDIVDGSSAFEAGLAKGDLVVDISNNSTRYMPLNKAIALMRDTKSNAIILKIRRELLIWRIK
ncbi:MAG: PDZ domain-containing protein [Candidatus Omnitrophota bacterium]